MTATAWDGLAAAVNGAQPDYPGSCMIALYPPPDIAQQLATPGGVDPGDMHLTVAWTGDCADVDQFTLVSAANALAARPPIDATVSGHARFTGGDDGDVIVALADSPALDALRRDAQDALAARGIPIASGHGFTAHMTLSYLDPGDPDPVGRLAPLPVTFTGVSAEYGTQRYTFPFGSPAPAAHEPQRIAGKAATGPIQAGKDAAAKAFAQQAEDYPAHAMAWMHHAAWKGPVKVPLDHIEPDMKYMDGADPGHVQDFVRRRQAGKKLKPVILVKTPSDPKLHLIDGHHRYLAEAELDEPVRAFIATVGTDHGAWEQMHQFQFTPSAGQGAGRGDTQDARDALAWAALEQMRPAGAWNSLAVLSHGKGVAG